MKTEDLKNQGLTDEQVAFVMAENGKDITREQEKIGEKDKEIELINSRLKEANKTIKSYKDMDIDGIKQSANEWETKAKQLEKEKMSLKNDYALKSAIDNAGSVDSELLLKIINKDDLKFQNDKIVGLDEQIANIKQNKPYLFKSEDDNGLYVHEPPTSNSGGVNAMESQIASIFDN